MDFSSYVVPTCAVATYLICAIIKPFIGDTKKFLPLIAGLLGVVFAIWYQGSFEFSTFLGGLASGLSATGIDNLVNLNKEN